MTATQRVVPILVAGQPSSQVVDVQCRITLKQLAIDLRAMGYTMITDARGVIAAERLH